MRDALHHHRMSSLLVPGEVRRLGRAAGWVILAALSGASCTADDVMQPRPDVARSLTSPSTQALTRAEHVRVRSLSDGQAIRGSTAVLLRRSAGLAVRVRTRELDPQESVDVFWAIFNDPAACMHPNPLTGAPCSPADLFVEAAQGSLHYVATLTADGRGRLDYSASLASDVTTGCVGDPFPCHGVTNPFGAEVHSPMFVPGGGAGRQAAQFVAR